MSCVWKYKKGKRLMMTVMTANSFTKIDQSIRLQDLSNSVHSQTEKSEILYLSREHRKLDLTNSVQKSSFLCLSHPLAPMSHVPETQCFCALSRQVPASLIPVFARPNVLESQIPRFRPTLSHSPTEQPRHLSFGEVISLGLGLCKKIFFHLLAETQL